MDLARLFDVSALVSSPPPGSVNVRVGKSVEGPGGKWVPCATEVSVGVYCSGLFEVGPGRRQVCASGAPMGSADEAFMHALELASVAAA